MGGRDHKDIKEKMTDYKRKPFNVKSFLENDGRAKQAVSKYLISKGYSILGSPNNNPYSADILTGKKDQANGVMKYQWHEMTMVRGWKESFPNTEYILMPSKKRNYVIEAKEDAKKPSVFFWSIKNDETEAYVFTGETMLDAPIVVEHFHNSPPQGEHFSHVPLSCAKLIKL